MSSRDRLGGRELGYAFFPSIATGSNVQQVSKAGDGVPRGAVDGALGPGISRPLIFTFEVKLPAMAGGTNIAADWDDVYPFLAGSDTTELVLLQWAKGMSGLGAFTRQSLAIYDAHVWTGLANAKVTDDDGTPTETAITTSLLMDDGNGAKFVAFRSTSWPEFDSYPQYGKLSWNSASRGGLLNLDRPKIYLTVENDGGATDAINMRIALFAYEI